LKNNVCIGENLNNKNNFYIYNDTPNKSLTQVIKEICENEVYKQLDNWYDQDTFQSYYLMSEFFNTSNVYDYKMSHKYNFIFSDRSDIKYFVRVVYNSDDKIYGDHLEIKMGWYDSNGKSQYEEKNKHSIDEYRGNTIAKIYRDEILPFFKTQPLCDILIFKSLHHDIKRYLFSLRMIQKFKEPWFDIIENKPIDIILKRNTKEQ
jgi:hypothetical protein